MQRANKTLKPQADAPQRPAATEYSGARAGIHAGPRMVAQRQQLRGLFGAAMLDPTPSSNSPQAVQRKPLCDVLTDVEETAIDADINASNWQAAIDKVTASDDVSFVLPPNLGKITYDASNENYGIAEQDAVDPAGNNTVDIKIGPLAFKSIPVLVSTVRHELLHALQHTLPSKDADKIGEADYVYGYAKEKSGYIEAAQEIHAYCMEIHNATKTGIAIDKDYLKSRAVNISNFWATLYGAGSGKKKSSKPAQYMNRMAPFVRHAYTKLSELGLDIEEYDKRGLPK